ncbi:hypothetical protein F5B22DRAFT_549260 [Xylaria bambusicola]|uniref:uncharacterized protein n=1 Tax=Xylaria bambusicola TaxID=326684 RepID=UPI002008C1B3|nr:uncharacterized protein F5B22DRAFT_549260 [Xylaria bambusicola]KAI0521736.1 hypothetical protein F5B22DRAFT_549260 [Xylaria bambusicola]
MCIQYVSRYPCGHIKSRWDICNKSKAVNILWPGKHELSCDKSVRMYENPDLQDSCGSTCLTKPYKCNKCGSSRKQLAWRCADCNTLRDSEVQVWEPCRCPKHRCAKAALGASFCNHCMEACVPRGPVMKWLCHRCGSPARTHAGEMECQKCLHSRCGKCKSLAM